jgi:hypothetical protein
VGAGREYDRLGIDDELRDPRRAVPMVRMPVAPGRNLAILVEVAARNQLLRARGHHAAREARERLDRRLNGRARRPTRTTPTTGEEDERDRDAARRAARARSRRASSS